MVAPKKPLCVLDTWSNRKEKNKMTFRLRENETRWLFGGKIISISLY